MMAESVGSAWHSDWRESERKGTGRRGFAPFQLLRCQELKAREGVLGIEGPLMDTEWKVGVQRQGHSDGEKSAIKLD